MSARETAHAILRAALTPVDGREAVRRALRLEGNRLLVGDAPPLELDVVRRIWLVGAGKATASMAQGALEALGDRIAGGTITTKYGHSMHLRRINVREAGHPLPDAQSVAGAADAIKLARAASEGDLILCLLSGGASALWAAPPSGVSLSELSAASDALLRAGTPISEMNAVRKHLSCIGGGQLARVAHPARVLTLAISDVMGDVPDAIGSGPTVPDSTTFIEALQTIARYRALVPPAVLRHLQDGAAGRIPETSKPGELSGNRFHVIARLRDALEAAAREAERRGYQTRILTDRLEGEAREAAVEIASQALKARDAGEGPTVLLWGGETTVTVRGDGLGGRSQELALAAALAIAGEPGITLAAFGTDGTDGPTEAAGAIVDGETVERGRAKGCGAADALARNDAHPFLRAAGDLLITGPTGTNVNDIVLALVEPVPA